MALDGLTRRVQTLDLSDPDCLVFNPTGDRTWLRETFDDVPRYLFRVSTPRSSGDTDRFWVKSKDSVIDPTTSSVDIFSGDDDYRTASMPYRHLCWREGADNFVSWTSSLLVALQYIFYRHTSPKDGSRLDDINFCIVDTTRFPRGVFLRDMDLIKVYYSYSTELEGFRGLRQRQHPSHSGFFYFGEYLSQGALKVEGKCQIISAQAMIDAGLFTLQPFRTMENRLPNGSRWANEVVRLREPFYSTTEDAQQTPHEELLAAKAISDRFGPRWRLPMACHLIALVPRKDEDGVVALAFQAIRLAGSYPSFCPDQTNCIRRDESSAIYGKTQASSRYLAGGARSR